MKLYLYDVILAVKQKVVAVNFKSRVAVGALAGKIAVYIDAGVHVCALKFHADALIRPFLRHSEGFFVQERTVGIKTLVGAAGRIRYALHVNDRVVRQGHGDGFDGVIAAGKNAPAQAGFISPATVEGHRLHNESSFLIVLYYRFKILLGCIHLYYIIYLRKIQTILTFMCRIYAAMHRFF